MASPKYGRWGKPHETSDIGPSESIWQEHSDRSALRGPCRRQLNSSNQLTRVWAETSFCSEINDARQICYFWARTMKEQPDEGAGPAPAIRYDVAVMTRRMIQDGGDEQISPLHRPSMTCFRSILIELTRLLLQLRTATLLFGAQVIERRGVEICTEDRIDCCKLHPVEKIVIHQHLLTS